MAACVFTQGIEMDRFHQPGEVALAILAEVVQSRGGGAAMAPKRAKEGVQGRGPVV